MKKLYCLLIFLSVGLWGYAILPTHFQFRHYNIENGVSSNSISAILQDSHGYIWLGTDNGLSRFDGNQFAFYQKSNPLYSNLHTSYINTLCEINTNELWLGTEMECTSIILSKLHLPPSPRKQTTTRVSPPGLCTLFRTKSKTSGLPPANKASFNTTHRPTN